MFRVSTTPIIMSTQNFKYSLRYWSYFVHLPPSNVAKLAWPRWVHVGCTKYDQYRRLYLKFCVLMMMGVVDTRNMYSELAE